MNIRTHILPANKQLGIFKDVIEKSSQKAIKNVRNYIPINNVDIVFYANTAGTIEHLGLGGRCISKHLVMIPINPSFPGLKISLEENLKRTIAHELYHCLRNFSFGEKRSLLQSLINEGLADHFNIEINHEKPQRWDTALDKEQLIKYMKLAEKEYNNSTYDHRSWFYGSKKENIPRWTGYSIGFYLIDQYLKKHPDKKPSNLHTQEAKLFI